MQYIDNIIFFIFLIVFAASFLGAFEIMLPNSWANKVDQQADKDSIVTVKYRLDFYQNKSRIKWLIFICSVVISFGSIYYTNNLVEELKERAKQVLSGLEQGTI